LVGLDALPLKMSLFIDQNFSYPFNKVQVQGFLHLGPNPHTNICQHCWDQVLKPSPRVVFHEIDEVCLFHHLLELLACFFFLPLLTLETSG